jgi:pimeloyl-ACP methyl ester carboxylesterase
MGTYAELTNGKVWFEEQGSGDPLILIHGGAVDGRFFDKNIEALAAHFRVIAVDLWGHGHTADRDGPFTLGSFSVDVAELIELVAGGSAHVLGHSIGAAVALDLTMRRPELVRKLIVVSGGFDSSAEEGMEGGVTDEMVDQTVMFLGESYGAVSPDGQDHFAVVVRKDFEMSAREPRFTPEDVGRVTQRTLVMAADDDIAALDHQLVFYRALPNGELAIVPGTSHFLLQEKPYLCDMIILDFLRNDPIATIAPVRRAGTISDPSG